jgi:hypothetical protein
MVNASCQIENFADQPIQENSCCIHVLHVSLIKNVREAHGKNPASLCQQNQRKIGFHRWLQYIEG